MKPAQPSQQVRLIGGRWRGSKLPVANRPGLRPTPDRVRETLYNWLGQTLTGWRVLDAFAGSGALGFEAASRGAAAVTLLEQDPALVAALQASAVRLGAAHLSVQRADAVGWMRRTPPAGFELVLLDPPFAASLTAPALSAAAPLVAPGGWLYLEAGSVHAPPPGFALHRQLRAGAVHAHLFHRDTP